MNKMLVPSLMENTCNYSYSVPRERDSAKSVVSGPTLSTPPVRLSIASATYSKSTSSSPRTNLSLPRDVVKPALQIL